VYFFSSYTYNYHVCNLSVELYVYSYVVIPCSLFLCYFLYSYNLFWDSYNLFFLTTSGTRIKTRKRNIAAPLDPAAFADAVVQIYLDNAGDLVNYHCILHPFSFVDYLYFYIICMLWLTCTTDWVIYVYRNLLQKALNLLTLTSQDTVTPFLRQAS
jgi:hypothetical protein